MDQSLKDELIALYVPVGTPFLGAYGVQKNMIGCSNTFLALDGWIGMHMQSQRTLVANTLHNFSLQMVDFLQQYQNEDWYQNILKRIAYQQDPEAKFEDSGIPWWPRKEDICHTESYQNPSCNINIENSSADIITIGASTSYSISNFNIAIKQYMMEAKDETLNQLFFEPKKAQKNSGVPTIVFFMQQNSTGYKFHFDADFEQ